MKRTLLLIAAALAIPAAQAQILTNPTATPASQVLGLAPQLLPFAGSDANFANLVNGLALGLPVTLTTPLSNGGSQVFTFTPSGTMTALEIAQSLEKARQLLISRGVAAPTAEQLGTALTGGALTTASGTTTTTPIVAAATPNTGAASAGAQSPANAVQAASSAPAANAAAGSTSTAVRNMSDSPFPRGISDTPPQPVPGVSEPAQGSASTVTPAAAATTAPTTITPAAPAATPTTSAGSAAVRVR